MQDFEELSPLVKSLAVALLAALLILPFQGSRGLWEPDEGRYTCVALQALQTSNFFNPALNDEVPHYTKPPLTYWAIAGSIALFGRNEWGVRLAYALAFIATVVVIYWMGKTFTPSRPWLPPLVYATFIAPFSAANFVTTDTILTLWEGLAVLGFVDWWKSEGKHSNRLLLMWGGFGLAFLTKGPPGLLPLGAILLLTVLARGWKSYYRLASFRGLLIFFVVGLGWYITVTATQPDLLHYFYKDEFISRIWTGSHHRNPEWYKSLIIYVPVLIVGTLPYTYFLLRAVPSTRSTLLSYKWWRHRLTNDWRAPFLVLWFLLPFMIFCVSRSRLALYLLPLFMPLSLMVGRLLEHRRLGRLSLYLLAAWTVFLLATKWGTAHYPYQKDCRPLAHAIASTIDPLPKEVLFVDTQPFWGLSLYLNCEVEDAISIHIPKRENREVETLDHELAQREPQTLIVVLKDNAERILKILGDLGYEAKILGGFQKWTFVSIASDVRAR